MNYNLKNSYPLNYNLKEIKSYSDKDSDVIFLSYLALNYGKKLPTYFKLVNKLCLDAFPSIHAKSFYLRQESLFYLEKKVTKLIYTQIFEEDIPDYQRIFYLELVEKIPPYSGNKFLYSELYNSIPSSLVVRGLIKPVQGGIILPKEQE